MTLSLISPLSWYFYFCCFLPLIVGIAAGWRRGDLPPITLYAITAAYLIGTLLPSYGHPLSPLMSAAIANLPAQHPHIDHALTEREFLQLMLTWIAAYSFATAARKRRRHTIDRQSSTLRGDPRSAIGWLTSWRPWRISPPWPCGSTRH